METCLNASCNHQVNSPNLFSGKIEYANYYYLVNETSTYIFLSLFCTVTVESIGWGGRYWSAKTAFWQPADGGHWDENTNSFIMQIVCLIIAPTFFSAANYILLGSLVRSTGSRYSSITAASFSKMFTFADFVCLLIQCIGGGIVGQAVTDTDMKNGLHIMAIGVIAQIAVTVIFSGLFLEFAWRYKKDIVARRSINLLGWTRFIKRRSSKQTSPQATPVSTLTSFVEPKEPYTNPLPSRKRIVLGEWSLLICNLLVSARSIYRAIEMLGFGPDHPGEYANQNLFLAMDASLMLVLLVVYIIIHPGLIDGRALF
ncbi:uncharacterized protein L201_001427 [Kwoniella dendrophila CBS 6074]|uniref:Uncharacterized protein n=1 Tax=Kwoniella dendrophila CBS 6074 TaxID=1295534 RepID=A0AAX4JPS6_9TREE